MKMVTWYRGSLWNDNSILSATLTTETHKIDEKEKEVAVLKVKFSKWLDGEKPRNSRRVNC